MPVALLAIDSDDARALPYPEAFEDTFDADERRRLAAATAATAEGLGSKRGSSRPISKVPGGSSRMDLRFLGTVSLLRSREEFSMSLAERSSSLANSTAMAISVTGTVIPSAAKLSTIGERIAMIEDRPSLT